MRKTAIIFGMLMITLVFVISVSLMENNKNLTNIKKYNKQYEEYYKKTFYGTDVITLINKATNENLKNDVAKDEKGYFIDNGLNTIKIEIKLLNDKKLTTYQMETLTNVGLEGFIKNFNLIQFKCTNIEYHESTRKVSKMTFEQIEE